MKSMNLQFVAKQVNKDKGPQSVSKQVNKIIDPLSIIKLYNASKYYNPPVVSISSIYQAL